MKAKFIVIAACAALVMAGCTKKKLEPSFMSDANAPIAFETPIVAPTTKAIVDFPDASKFKVSAYKYAGEYTGWVNTGVWMDGVTIAKLSPDPHTDFASWGPVDRKYYWPKDGSKLAFSAYAPETATGLEIGATGVVATNYTTHGNQVDILFSDRVIDLTGNTEYAENAMEETHQALYGVQIKFNHALARLDFTLKTAEDYSATKTVTLKSIAVNNIIKSGSFNQGLTNTGENKDGKGVPAWTVANEPETGTYTYSATDFGDYSVAGITAAGLTITNTAKGSGATSNDFNSLYLIPQDLELLTGTSYENSKIVVKYEIATVGSTADPEQITYEKPLKELVFNDTGYEHKLLIGKKYCINISIGLNEIYFAPVVVDWVGVDINDVNSDLGDEDPVINIDPES